MKALALAVLVAALVVPSALAKDRTIASYCSESGDVCTAIHDRGGVVYLQIVTYTLYFKRYQLCVRGPKSKVCHTFPISKSGQNYASTINWSKNFPNQGKGVYKVTWQYSAKTLSFRLPL